MDLEDCRGFQQAADAELWVLGFNCLGFRLPGVSELQFRVTMGAYSDDLQFRILCTRWRSK